MKWAAVLLALFVTAASSGCWRPYYGSTYAQPAYPQAPLYQPAPVTQQAVVQPAPVYQQPVYQQPVYQQPVYAQAPAQQACTPVVYQPQACTPCY